MDTSSEYRYNRQTKRTRHFNQTCPIYRYVNSPFLPTDPRSDNPFLIKLAEPTEQQRRNSALANGQQRRRGANLLHRRQPESKLTSNSSANPRRHTSTVRHPGPGRCRRGCAPTASGKSGKYSNDQHSVNTDWRERRQRWNYSRTYLAHAHADGLVRSNVNRGGRQKAI